MIGLLICINSPLATIYHNQFSMSSNLNRSDTCSSYILVPHYSFHHLPTDGTAVLAPASRPKGVLCPCPFEGAPPLEKVRHVCNWPSSVMPAQTPTPIDMCFNLSPWAIHGPWPGEGIDGTSGIPPAGFETPRVHWWTSPSLVRATKSSP